MVGRRSSWGRRVISPWPGIAVRRGDAHFKLAAVVGGASPHAVIKGELHILAVKDGADTMLAWRRIVQGCHYHERRTKWHGHDRPCQRQPGNGAGGAIVCEGHPLNLRVEEHAPR